MVGKDPIYKRGLGHVVAFRRTCESNIRVVGCEHAERERGDPAKAWRMRVVDWLGALRDEIRAAALHGIARSRRKIWPQGWSSLELVSSVQDCCRVADLGIPSSRNNAVISSTALCCPVISLSPSNRELSQARSKGRLGQLAHLRVLLKRLDLVADLEVFPVLEAHTTFGALAHLRHIFLDVLE